MSKRANEKNVENLFHAHALRVVECDLYTPNLREEAEEGFDARLHLCQRSLYLQYKAPEIHPEGFRVKLREAQHKRLLQKPALSAYYVVGLFDNAEHMSRLHATCTAPLAFLSRFVAIEISGLPAETRFLGFSRWDFSLWPDTQPSVDVYGHAEGETKLLVPDYRRWTTANELLTLFQGGHPHNDIRPPDWTLYRLHASPARVPS